MTEESKVDARETQLWNFKLISTNDKVGETEWNVCTDFDPSIYLERTKKLDSEHGWDGHGLPLRDWRIEDARNISLAEFTELQLSDPDLDLETMEDAFTEIDNDDLPF